MLKIEVREVYVRTGSFDRPPHAAAGCPARTCPVQRCTGNGFLTPDLTRRMGMFAPIAARFVLVDTEG